MERLQTTPGIERRAAEGIVAEVGADLRTFPSAGHLASWVGLCPGNHESAGKRQSGRTTNGNTWLRTLRVQCGWAAGRSKGPYLQAMFRRLAARRGTKRALVAVGHRLLAIIFRVLKNGETYRELGADYLDRAADRERLKARLVKGWETLGVEVTVEDAQPVA